MYTVEPDPILVRSRHLRALLSEPGGRRRMREAVDPSGASPALDDHQLLARVHDLLERGRIPPFGR